MNQKELNKMNGLVLEGNLKNLNIEVGTIAHDLLIEGFDSEDVKEYIITKVSHKMNAMVNSLKEASDSNECNSCGETLTGEFVCEECGEPACDE